MIGSHAIKVWSITQSVVSISSGEAEYYAMVKGGSSGLGIQAMMDELGIKMNIRINTDAKAAIGIAMRRGVGKVKHIAVSHVWLQEKVSQGIIEVVKVASGENISDVLTKKISSQEMQWHMHNTSQVRQKRSRKSGEKRTSSVAMKVCSSDACVCS